MQGFLQRRIPRLLRRGITLAPALLVLAAGVDRRGRCCSASRSDPQRSSGATCEAG